MDFEEFFTKKRIDLDALQKVEPALFSEFKTHFVQMGEKSFDHTKKYWFNKLRLQFPLAVEPKTEKVKIDNPLAEQTITESLIEQTTASPKPGFTPKFRAANVPKPVGPPKEDKPEQQAASSPPPKLGFTPKFRAVNPPKPVAEQAEPAKTEEPTPPAPAPKLGFTPKFRAASPPKPAAEQAGPAKTEEPTPPAPAPKLGFTPKFKAASPPKPAAEPVEQVPDNTTDDIAPVPPESAETKPAYKPRFNMKNLPKKEE